MTDATITVTNLGDRGVRAVFGVIYPPQVALVGFGKIADRVWDVDDGIGIRPAVTGNALGRSPRDRRPRRRAASSPTSRAACTTPRSCDDRRSRSRDACRARDASRPKPTSTTLAPDDDLQEALDLDSMDFLNFLIARRAVDRGRDPRVRLPPRAHVRVVPTSQTTWRAPP